MIINCYTSGKVDNINVIMTSSKRYTTILRISVKRYISLFCESLLFANGAYWHIL